MYVNMNRFLMSEPKTLSILIAFGIKHIRAETYLSLAMNLAPAVELLIA